MAHQVTSKDIPINGEHLEKGKIATLQMICGGIGGIGLLTSIIYLINGSGESRSPTVACSNIHDTTATTIPVVETPDIATPKMTLESRLLSGSPTGT